MRPVLAVDQGTSGTKALVVCPERGILAAASVEVRPRHGDDGSVEVDPAALLGSVVQAGRRALAEAGVPVAAVGLANQGETVLAWDPATGRPLTPAIVWQDRRSAGLCDDLAASDPALPARLAALTGLPLDPYFAAPKLAWLRRTATRDGVVTTSDAWLVHALTGAFVTDATTASRTMLLDLDAVAWSAEALTAFGLEGESLPQLVGCAGEVGTTQAFSPGTDLPLTGLVVDQQAALLAEGCLAPGTAKCTYGTGAFLLATVGPRAVRSAHGLATSVAWLLGTPTYCLDGQVYTVASAVRWLADLGVISGAEDLDRLGLAVPDSGGAVFVPAFAGLAAPSWRSDARAALSGLTLGTTRGHVVRALVEGIVAQVVDCADAIAADLGAPLASLRVDGGLTRSRLLLQTQADLLQAPVEVYPSPDATALGAAVLALHGADPAAGVEDLVAALTPRTATPARYEPAIGPDEAASRLAAIRSASAVR